MGKISYKAELMLVVSEPDLIRDMNIKSFSVTGGSVKAVELNSTNDNSLLAALKEAKAQKNMTCFKAPSKDELDAVLLALFQMKAQFGFNFDISASYTENNWIQIGHFFGEDATVKNPPIRVGGKKLSLKVEFSFPKAHFQHGEKQNGKWTDADDWL